MTSLRVRTRRVEGPPVVGVRVWFPGGAVRERTAGEAFVTGRLLAEGTRHRDWRRLAEDLEGRGMVLSTFGSYEIHGVALDALAEDWELAIDWAAEIALTPSFDEERCAWLARQAAGELQSLGDQPDVRTGWAFREQLYVPARQALPLQGSLEGLRSLTAENARGFHAGGGSPIVTVAGRIDEAACAQRVRRAFAAASESAARTIETAEFGDPQADIGRREIELPAVEGAGQAQLFAGHLTVTRADPDYEALRVAGVVLGGGSGLSGRVPSRVREDEGLAYTARAETVVGSGLARGRLAAYVGTSTETVARAEQLVREELSRLVEDGIDDRELDEARSYLLGREPFARETARQWADLLAGAELFGLPLERPQWRARILADLELEQVNAAIRRHLRPDALRVTVGLPGRRPRDG